MCVKVPVIVFAKLLLWLFYRLGLCCGIVGKFGMYTFGGVTSHPVLINIYTAYRPRRLITKCSIVLHINRTPEFSFESLHFLFVPKYSASGNKFLCLQTWKYNVNCQTCA
jgi:hypothetical protein